MNEYLNCGINSSSWLLFLVSIGILVLVGASVNQANGENSVHTPYTCIADGWNGIEKSGGKSLAIGYL